MRLSKSVLGAVLAVSLCAPALAGTPNANYAILLKTPDLDSLGAFVVNVTDCAHGCATFTKFDRIYRSKGAYSTHLGWFGYGWGSSYERSLQFAPDGSMVANDYGAAGTQTIFEPAHLRSTQQIIDDVMSAAGQAGIFTSSARRQEYLRALTDRKTRDSEWVKYRDASLIKPTQPAIGVEMHDASGREQLVRLREGYQRRLADGTFAAYANLGSYSNSFEAPLIRLWDSEHHFVSITYDSRQTATLILDDLGNRFNLYWNSNGNVHKIQDAHGRVAIFHYATNKSSDPAFQQDDLTDSQSFDGTTFKYVYDADDNLTSFSQPGGNVARAGYNADYGEVVWIDQGGAVTHYQYSFDDDYQGREADVVDELEPGKPLATYAYVWDAQDDYIERILEIGSEGTSQQTYDANQNVVAVADTVADNGFVFYNTDDKSIDQVNTERHVIHFFYQGDAGSGNVRAMSLDTTMANLTYDANDKLVAVDLNGDDTRKIALTYDAAGNAVVHGDAELVQKVRAMFSQIAQLLGTNASKIGVLGIVAPLPQR